MEDLENSNGIRFLRHHYTDPMTGKDEWRLIHAGPGGVLLDSLIKKDTDKDKKQATQSSISELLGTGGLPEPTEGAANPALRKRPSDQPGGPGLANGGTPSPGAPIPPDPPQSTGNQAGAGPTAAGTTLPDRLPPSNPAGSAVNSQTGGISAGLGIGGEPPRRFPRQ